METVKTVLAICKQAEACFDTQSYYQSVMNHFGAYSLHPNLSKVRRAGGRGAGCWRWLLALVLAQLLRWQLLWRRALVLSQLALLRWQLLWRRARGDASDRAPPAGPRLARPPHPLLRPLPPPQHEALASSAVRAAAKLHAALIVVFTVTGRSARVVAKYRPNQPILTVGPLGEGWAEG